MIHDIKKIVNEENKLFNSLKKIDADIIEDGISSTGKN